MRSRRAVLPPCQRPEGRATFRRMSTLTEIEAAVPFLSAKELAELERIVRERRKMQGQTVARRAPKAKAALALPRPDAKGWRAEIAERNWRA